MSASATLAPVLDVRDARALVESSHAAPQLSLRVHVRCLILHLADRFRASFAFHDRSHYIRLVRRAASLVGYAGALGPFSRILRAHDSQGLGVWLLARIAPGPRLDELCRRAIATRGGPPRPVARLLELSLAGKPVCWFGESGGFTALSAESQLSAAIAAALTAIEVADKQGKPDWPVTLMSLTRTSSSLQSAVRAFRRVSNQTIPAADDAVNLAFQAVNIARRALNHTDLMAVDERLATEITRLALATANSACDAAVEICTKLTPAFNGGDAGPHGKLASLARTLDALLARISATLRDDMRRGEWAESLTPQFAHVIGELSRVLRPWGIQLGPSDARTPGAASSDLCHAANELLESSAETLDAWAVLHDTFRSASQRGDSTPSDAPRSVPLWATRLMNAIAASASTEEIADSIRRLAGPADHAAAGAVAIAALRSNSLQLRHELWKLIRAVYTPDMVRLLSFQLFWRLRSPFAKGACHVPEVL